LLVGSGAAVIKITIYKIHQYSSNKIIPCEVQVFATVIFTALSSWRGGMGRGSVEWSSALV
jgi:hypothetical protein